MSKILIVSLNFYPEPTSTGKYKGELAAYLRESSHELRMVTAPLYYPSWKVAQGYLR
jgi:colanic acid biosynthesis glycosyl transferase WcaI